VTDFYMTASAGGAGVYFTPDAICYHLRGSISASGGQRIPRLSVEYFAWRNTRYLMRKHWPFLRAQYGLRGSPLSWTIGFFVRRQLRHVQRALRHGFRSSFAE
jgi:hypothetical protein